MDSFTQRMLERAKLRRQKLDSLMSNTEYNVKSRQSPLRDTNNLNTLIIPKLTSEAASNCGKIIQTREEQDSDDDSSQKSSDLVDVVSQTASPNNNLLDGISTREKENFDQNISNVRSKLFRMGKLYSGDSNRELSSPIHRTEEKFMAEDNSQCEGKNVKRGLRLHRLAALASEINNWEDDLSHPSIVPTKKEESKAEKIHAQMNKQIKAGLVEPQPSTSGYGRWKSNAGNKRNSHSPTRQFNWDSTIVENLDCFQDKNLFEAKNENTKTEETVGSLKVIQLMDSSSKSPEKNVNNGAGLISTAESSGKSSSSVCNNRHRLGGYNGSPKSIGQSPGSVLSKASLFETKNTPSKTKDPAEMTLSERMAFFEKNKGDALIPKAPLSLSVPTKKLLEQREKSPAVNNSDPLTRNGGMKNVSSNRTLFEQGLTKQELENSIFRENQTERYKELEMLRSRFNKNKEVAQAAAGFGIRSRKNSEPTTTSPKSSPVCPVKPTPATEHVPPAPPLPSTSLTLRTEPIPNKSSPTKQQVTGTPPLLLLLPPPPPAQLQSSNFNIQNLETNYLDVERQRVSTSRLYPDLAEMESPDTETIDTEYTIGTTEEETATCEETDYDEYLDNDDMKNSNLENSFLSEVISRQSTNKKRTIELSDTNTSTSEISVLDEMNEYLEGCLESQEGNYTIGPTPPKMNRGSGDSLSSISKNLKFNSNAFQRSPLTTSKHNEPQNIDIKDNTQTPLIHSVSFYRRQKSQILKTPVKKISKTIDISSDYEQHSCDNDNQQEAILVQRKIQNLKEEINKQQTIIGQSSQAVNFCAGTVEFSGSREQVEGERTLLIATHRRQAALNEIQRLKVEGTIRPAVPGVSEIQESGSLTVSAITLPLKKDHTRNNNDNTCIHFLCLVRHLDSVIATPVVQAEPGDSCIRFPSTLKLDNLYSDFKITIEVYSLETRAEILPHEVKYHIYNDGYYSGSSGNKKGSKAPKKFLKSENRLIMPLVQSPAGPSAVRSPSFVLSGYVVFSLKEISRQQFTLNKIPKNSPLEPRLQMHVSCELSLNVEHRGFLTMFEDVSGFGAWHRRWCLLKGDTLSYWKYPDDERKKPPIGSFELQEVTNKTIGLVARDICARPNTFLLETVRPSQSNDIVSLKVVRQGSLTTIRNLLSADTKEDRLEWCSKLNKTLHLLRAWAN